MTRRDPRHFLRRRRDRDNAVVGLERLPVENRAFKGSDPRGGPTMLADAVTDGLERHWQTATNFDRRAEVISTEQLTTTGTVAITLRVVDDGRFVFSPGQFIGVKTDKAGTRRQRAPYCILSPPGDDNTFGLLVRVVPDGPRSRYLAALRVGDIVDFRGPTGRSMVPKEEDTELVLVATGVGVSPLYSLACHLLSSGSHRKIRLLWGLRTEDDICLVDHLDRLAATYPNFNYQISLSAPSVAWTGLRGRVSETAPTVTGPLAGKHFYLCGNGAMVSEMSTVLAEFGVDDKFIYKEAFFDARHRPDRNTLADIRARFGAHAAVSPVVSSEETLFAVEHPLGGRADTPPAVTSGVVNRTA